MYPTRFDPLEAGGIPGGMGALANGLLRYGSLREYRAATPLPKDAQELVDTTVVEVGLNRLALVRRFIERGLTVSMPNWLAVPEFYWETVTKVGHAIRTMSPQTKGERQVADRAGNRIPIYLTMDDFSFGIRELLAAERAGAPLDTSHVAQATRRVNEAIEDAGINGAITVGGNTSPGLLNAPDVNTRQYTGGATGRAWDDATKTGEHILVDLMGMIGVLQADSKFGPYELFVGTSYGNALGSDFKANSDKSTRSRLLETEGLDAITVVDQMPQHRTALIQMTSDVVDVIVGDEPMPVSWTPEPGWVSNFAVMACIVSRYKSDGEGQSGIVLGDVN